MGGYMGQLVGQWLGSGQMTNLIKLELIDIIQFCLKIYDFWRHPYLWLDGWFNGWAHVISLKSNKSWPNQYNSIMDILDILLDILLKPPQPLVGLFFTHNFLNIHQFSLLIPNWISCYVPQRKRTYYTVNFQIPILGTFEFCSWFWIIK